MALIGLGAFVFLWLGLPGFVGFGFGITASGLTIGIASGYWVGDAESDILVTKLMDWLREKRSAAPQAVADNWLRTRDRS